MTEDKDNIIQYAWDEVEHYAMSLSTEIQADESVFRGPKLKLDDVISPGHSSGKIIEKMEEQVTSLRDALSTKNKTKLMSCISSIENTGYVDEDIYWLIDEVKNNYSILNIYDAELIYKLQNKDIFIPEVIIPAQERLINLAKNNPSILYSITPRDFEELVAEIFDRQGFNVELTKATRDGGKDIVAIQSSMGIKLKYIVECKRYARDNKVTLDIVQRLYGVKMAENANKAILVTTSSFTKDANKFASQHCWDLSLKDNGDLLSWLKDIK